MIPKCNKRKDNKQLESNSNCNTNQQDTNKFID